MVESVSPSCLLPSYSTLVSAMYNNNNNNSSSSSGGSVSNNNSSSVVKKGSSVVGAMAAPLEAGKAVAQLQHPQQPGHQQMPATTTSVSNNGAAVLPSMSQMGAAMAGQGVMAQAANLLGGGGADKKAYPDQNASGAATTTPTGELTDLATQEISLDLQGLIDDTHFTDDNLFGDLMETAKKNDMVAAGGGGHLNNNNGMGGGSGWGVGMGMFGRGQPSPGSSDGQSSPTSCGYGGGGGYQVGNNNNGGGRSAVGTLAYLPGSVHNGASFGHINHQQQQSIQVRRNFLLL